MTTTRILAAQDDDMDEAVRTAAALLRTGEVVAVPTETVYGLGADAFNADAVAKIYAAKERPEFDPLIVHVTSRKQLEEVAAIPAETRETVRKIMAAFWPGPITFVLPKTDRVPDLVTAGLPTVAVRQSANKIFRAIGKALGNPIAAPSANRFGRISPTSAGAVAKELDGRIPLIVDAGACHNGLESTIIRVFPPPAGKNKAEIHILRPGPVTKKDLQPFGRVTLAPPPIPGSTPESPGQLPSHYAPTTPLLLFDSSTDFHPQQGKRYALLSYRGDPADGYLNLHPWEAVEILSPGSGKAPEAAVRLYFLLRKLDELGLDFIVAEPVPRSGLGQAIMNRLERAAEPR